MQLVAVVSQKGGGGKTTVATNLAVASAAVGISTLLLDLDPQQSALQWGHRRNKTAPKTKASLAVSAADCNTMVSRIAAAKAGGAKLLILDTPPAKGPEADIAAAAANIVLVVVQPAILDLMTLAETHALGGVATRPAFVVFNRTPVSGTNLQDATETVEAAGFSVARAALTDRAVYRAAPVEGLGAMEADKGERKAAHEVEKLYRWMRSELADHPRVAAAPSDDDWPLGDAP